MKQDTVITKVLQNCLKYLWLNTSCEPHTPAMQLQKQPRSEFTLAKERILQVPFASRHSEMKWCHHLRNPKP